MLATKLAESQLPADDPFRDFRNFLYYIFTTVLEFGEPDPIQYDIADWMVNLPAKSDGIKRGQVQAMRGCGKSVIACALCCWFWYMNPTIRITMVGSNEKKAAEFASLVKQIIDRAELLEHLRPSDEDQYTMRRGRKVKQLAIATNQVLAFDVRGAGPGKDPSFGAFPVFGGWTGSHPDVLIPDDVEIPENSGTVLKREKLYGKLREGESLVMEKGMLLYMGTPQTEESIYTKLDEAGYEIRKWPAELPNLDDEDQTHNVAEWILERVAAGEKPGMPSYPERFPVERLIEKKAMGLAYYNLQMLLNTRLSDEERYPLKLRNLIVYDAAADLAPTNCVWGTLSEKPLIESFGFTGDRFFGPGYVEPTFEEYQDKVMYIDPKGGGSDSVGYAVAAVLNGIIYILDAGGLAVGTAGGTSDVVMERLARIAATWQVKRVCVESNWGGSKYESAYANLLQPVMGKWNGPTSIELRYVQGQKEKRILDCLEPIVNSHRLVVSETVARHGAGGAPARSLWYQFTHLTRESGSLGHDDEIDALYGAVNEFVEMVVLDPEVQERERAHAEAVKVAEDWDRETRRNPMFGGLDPWRQKKRSRWGYRPQKRWRRS